MDQPKLIKKDLSKLKPAPNLLDYEKTYKEFTWEKAEKEMLNLFDDGTLNITYNCIDRHAEGDKKDKNALLFTSADGKKENYTFSDLKTLTDKFANVLISNDIKKGDRVFIF